MVTSTQTLLLDNPGLLKGLFSALRQGEGGSTRCTPLYFLADHQVKGRGRGSNRWISYSGCLQTTACFFLDNHDQGGDQPQGACKRGKRLPLVMVQYLASIAIVRARREFLSSASCAEKRHVLGLDDPSTAVADEHHGDREWRIKWPNDVLELPGLGGEGGTHREFMGPRKVAGTLVNITNLRVPFACSPTPTPTNTNSPGAGGVDGDGDGQGGTRDMLCILVGMGIDVIPVDPPPTPMSTALAPSEEEIAVLASIKWRFFTLLAQHLNALVQEHLVEGNEFPRLVPTMMPGCIRGGRRGRSSTRSSRG